MQNVTTRQWRGFGHVHRIDQNSLPYITLYGGIHSQTNRGRPKKRLFHIYVIKRDYQNRGLKLIEAQ